MRYLRNAELRRQLVYSSGLWLLSLIFGLVFLREQRALLFFFQGMELLLILVWFFFTARRYRRFGELAYDLDRLLHGERQIRLEEYREGELEVLANELQKLLSRLSGQSDRLQQEKRYLSDSLADISHQLRTPLTSLNLILARLSEEGEERERRRLVCEAKRLLERTTWLVETLLKISRIDAGTAVFDCEAVDAGKLIQASLEPLSIPMELRGQRLALEIEENAGFQGDFSWSAEAVGNLVKNCMENAGEGKTIWIAARENELYMEIEVSDNGPGIAPEDLPRIFERFYRGRNSQGQGAGIGLALARMIVNAQNGTLRAGNRPGGGAEFVIRFYKGIV